MNRSDLKKVLKYTKKYLPLIIVSILLALICVASTLYVPILIGHAIDHIVYGKVEFDVIKDILIKIALMVLITAVCQWIMSTINNYVSFKVVKDIRETAFKKLQILPLKYIDSHPQGDIVSRIISDADQFADGLLMGFTQLFTGVITIFGTLGFMLYYNRLITAVVVCVTPLSLFAAAFISKKTYTMFLASSQTRGEQTALIEEVLGNEKVVKAFSKEDEMLEKFDEINDRLAKVSLRALFFSSLTNPTTRFVNNIVYAAVGFAGAYACINNNMSVGVLACFLSYANQYTKPFNEISSVITELQNSLACAGRLFELIEETPQPAEPSDAVTLEDVKGNIDIENVNFAYTEDKPLIKNFNLSVAPGQNVAIVGPTGCGKTTVINLLMRFYDVDSGCIKVDHSDIRDMTRESLRKSYGMVLQETWLKAGTIKENLTMGKENASMDEIIDASKAAHSYSFIRRLPDGFDTVIGEDGGSLSAGQKQLLCITRIMLSLPPMLILDEATSSIDTRTERHIQNSFIRMMEGRTSFIVAHRLSTIKSADVILVMKDGNVIEQGDHETLLKANGFYAKLYNSR